MVVDIINAYSKYETVHYKTGIKIIDKAFSNGLPSGSLNIITGKFGCSSVEVDVNEGTDTVILENVLVRVGFNDIYDTIKRQIMCRARNSKVIIINGYDIIESEGVRPYETEGMLFFALKRLAGSENVVIIVTDRLIRSYEYHKQLLFKKVHYADNTLVISRLCNSFSRVDVYKKNEYPDGNKSRFYYEAKNGEIETNQFKVVPRMYLKLKFL